MATGADREPDANPAKLIADYDISATVIQIVTYAHCRRRRRPRLLRGRRSGPR